MENTKISAVSTAKTTKHGWLTRGSRLAKKAIMSLTIFGCMASMCATQAFAATGDVDTSSLSALSVQALEFGALAIFWKVTETTTPARNHRA